MDLKTTEQILNNVEEYSVESRRTAMRKLFGEGNVRNIDDVHQIEVVITRVRRLLDEVSVDMAREFLIPVTP